MVWFYSFEFSVDMNLRKMGKNKLVTFSREGYCTTGKWANIAHLRPIGNILSFDNVVPLQPSTQTEIAAFIEGGYINLWHKGWKFAAVVTIVTNCSPATFIGSMKV